MAAPPLATLFVDGPPAAHTGGFGEPTCHACHFDHRLDDPAGGVRLGGVPHRYVPGRAYTITITLHREGLRRGGFELAVRFADGRQAGSLRPLDERVALADSLGIRYARQTRAGTSPAAPDTARWRLEWVAPSGGSTVLFHVAANAADGDDSALGDFIYLASARARRGVPGPPDEPYATPARNCSAKASGPTGSPVAARARSS